MFQIFFTEKQSIESFRDFCAHVDRRKFRDFVRLLHRHGVFMSPSNTLHSLSCIAHTEADIDRTADAIGAALEELR
jgi:glutamate-1-semialdehyde aminotransferase